METDQTQPLVLYEEIIDRLECRRNRCAYRSLTDRGLELESFWQ